MHEVRASPFSLSPPPLSLLFSSSKKQRRTSYGFYSLVVPPPRTPLSSPSNRPRPLSLPLSLSPRLKPRTNNARLAVEMVTLVLVRCRFARTDEERRALAAKLHARDISFSSFENENGTRRGCNTFRLHGPGWNFKGIPSMAARHTR